MPQFTLAQMPGTQVTVTIPEGHTGPYTLRHAYAQAGLDPNVPNLTRSVSVNGHVVTDLETEIPDGSTVLIAEKIRGA